MQDSTKTDGRRHRGRPRRISPDAALDGALDAFWTSGYNGTTLDDLSAATGMNRPSLYATFGDKRHLYLHALGRFGQMMEAAVKSALDEAPTMREALTRFYGGALGVYLSGSTEARGCFVVCTATVEAPQEPEIRQALQRVLAVVDELLAARFRQAVDAGELPADTDVDILGALAAATLHSLAVRARAGTPKAALEALVTASIDRLLHAVR